MKRTELIVTERNALLESETAYIVAVGYDAERKEWNYGHYFNHWGISRNKANALRAATENFINIDMFDYKYITRNRMEEIANAAIQNLDEIGMLCFLEDAQMEAYEVEYFEIEESEVE